MQTIGERVKETRKSLGLTMVQFAAKIGISDAAISQIESGKTGISDRTIRDICREFGVNETWLRTGAGDPKAEQSRAAEYAAMAKSLLSDKPESFRTALVTALMRFDPDGPEWAALEKIYESVEQEYRGAKTEKEP